MNLQLVNLFMHVAATAVVDVPLLDADLSGIAGGPGAVDAVPFDELSHCTPIFLTSPGCRSSCYCC